MNSVVVDTNVGIVANSREAEHASPSCVLACVDCLEEITKGRRRLVIDDSWLILDEYQNKMNSTGQPGVGDAFLKWVFQNQANPETCEWVTVEPHPERGFDVFPNDPDLAAFDPSDRKFVAVALASPSSPPIVNAVDSDWWLAGEALERNGVEVVELCPERLPA